MGFNIVLFDDIIFRNPNLFFYLLIASYILLIFGVSGLAYSFIRPLGIICSFSLFILSFIMLFWYAPLVAALNSVPERQIFYWAFISKWITWMLLSLLLMILYIIRSKSHQKTT